MIYLIILGFLIPLAARRNPLHMLLTVRFQSPGLIFLTFAIQLALVVYSHIMHQKLPYGLAITFLLLMAALYRNRHMPGVGWIFTGAFLNFAALIAHNGAMPVSLTALDMAGLSELADFSDSSRHQAMSDSWTNWLGDWIPLIVPYGKNYILSPGDVIVGIGIMITIFRYSKKY